MAKTELERIRELEAEIERLTELEAEAKEALVGIEDTRLWVLEKYPDGRGGTQKEGYNTRLAMCGILRSTERLRELLGMVYPSGDPHPEYVRRIDHLTATIARYRAAVEPVLDETRHEPRVIGDWKAVVLAPEELEAIANVEATDGRKESDDGWGCAIYSDFEDCAQRDVPCDECPDFRGRTNE